MKKSTIRLSAIKTSPKRTTKAKAKIQSIIDLERNQLQKIFNSIDEPIYVACPKTYELLYINDSLKKVVGDGIGKKCYEVLQGLDRPCDFCTNKYILGKNSNKPYIWEFENKLTKRWYHCIDKAIPWIDHSLVRYEMAIDITDRKKAESALKTSEERYRAIFEQAADAVILLDVNTHSIVEFNNRVCELLGYTREELSKLKISDFEAVESRSETISHIESIDRQGRATFATRYKKKDKELRDMLVNATAFTIGKGRFIQFVLHDITDSKKKEEFYKYHLEQSKKIIEGTIQAMGKAIEIRDPYTAGHQRRVAKLACMIAKKMGFDEEKIESVRVASKLHDIGKIYVPAEILAKPGKLSSMEFNMIREHSRIGYEILKTEEFPWPIAKIVFQHHERGNGSGYPDGITQKNIMIEARILAVADVVEAIASHRPYRPALGLKKALVEVHDNRGKLYDKDVVNACVDLFCRRHSVSEKK
jgi:PAS domain S-box-containing protein/putative nucleotidyltransferase with HDIG domain